MRQTSLLAYAEAKKSLGNNQKIVLEAIQELAPCNDKQIAEHLGWPINSVTPRRGELFKKDRIVEAYIAKDFTGRSCTYWKPTVTEREVGDSY